MKAPYGLEILDDCTKCAVREERLFCNLPDDALRQFDEMKFTTVYPKGAILFEEGQEPLSVFVVCSGMVKLSTTSADGRTLITQIADAGDVLGVSAVVAGRPYEATAETLDPCHLKLVKRDDFLGLLRRNGEVSLRVAQLLSASCHGAHRQARSIGLGQTVQARLARLLLDRCAREGVATPQGIRVRLNLTHEEIAQMIGSSRETVTRQLSVLRGTGTIEGTGSAMIVRDIDALRMLANE